jgi:hypothetical protein
MISIRVATSDNKIWNQSLAYTEMIQAMCGGQSFKINLIGEGPDARSIGLYNFLESKAIELGYNLNDVTLMTANALEQHTDIKVIYKAPLHLLDNAKEYIVDVPKHDQLKHFGMFIGRSNAQRLHLATYLDSHYSDNTIMSYHFNLADDFHSRNIGLEDLIRQYGICNIQEECNFIHKCPIRIKQAPPVLINKDQKLNASQQLLQQDRGYFSQTYQDFFVEIVCESYFTGSTFFPTEKIFRPILLKTPFIVQGPQNFLHNLQGLGFKTFSNWWDEGYSEDPDGQQMVGIKSILDTLATKKPTELFKMYKEMLPVLEHNYKVAMKLTATNFETIK